MKTSNRPEVESLEAREALSGLHALKHPHAPAPRHVRHPAIQMTTNLHATQTTKPPQTAPASSTPPSPSSAPTAPNPASSASSSPDGATLSVSTRQTNAAVGPTYDFQGVGSFGPLSSGKVVGSIDTVGSVSTGRAGGTLTITDGQGAIVLKVTGPVQSPGSTLPSELNYTVWGGYGSYAGAQGTGTAALQLSGSSATLAFHHA